jgi:uncharacterized repeat protein (TIGR02543 family)
MTEKGVTFYAVWEANTYAVSFNSNGGTGSMESQNIAFATTANITANAFNKDGYKFTGWNTKADGTGTAYANSASITMVEGGITLFAQWQKEAYTIVVKNGSTTLLTLENAEFGSVISEHEDYEDIISRIEVPTGKVYDGLYVESDTNFETKYQVNSQVIDFGNDGDTITLIVRLASEIGTIAIIKDIHCTGEIKRRLLDLGMVNGTKIKAIFRSPGNDPTAFEVRNTLIALRKEDAENIIID